METLEIWKDVIWYEGKYEVSNFGNVMSLNYKRTWKQKLLIPSTNSTWYKMVKLYSNNLQKYIPVHRLVVLAFIENTFNKQTVNHINWIKKDNRIENLEWMTYSENTLHAFRTGLMKQKFWAENKLSKSVLQFTKDNIFIRSWGSLSDVQRELNISQGNISMCCIWKYKTVGWFIWKLK